MNVLIVGCFDLLMHPYSDKYIEILKKNAIDYDLIYWNRSGDSNSDEHYIPFQFPLNTYSSRMSKFEGYIRYRRFVLKYLKSGKYDKVFFLTTQAMVFFFPLAFERYKKKYIFDYRDETYESNRIYRKIVQACIRNSYKTVISSPGFKEIFDASCVNKFVLCHNTKGNFDNGFVTKIPSKKMRITYWGQIRLPEYFIRLIRVFENDSRFVLKFHGEGNAESLIQYVKENKITNVFFSGRFEQNDIKRFASETDILLNCYSNDSYQKRALTVKMYEGICFGIPMLVQKDSFMSKYLKRYGYPFIEVDFDYVEEPDLIKEAILGFTDTHIDKHTIFDIIRADQDVFVDAIVKFIQGEEE